VVLTIDEKTQVQALDETQPLLPVDSGRAKIRTTTYATEPRICSPRSTRQPACVVIPVADPPTRIPPSALPGIVRAVRSTADTTNSDVRGVR